MKQILMWVLGLTGILFLTNYALAWSKAGHMATGAVAYRVLKKDSPGTIGKVTDLLKQQVYYQKRWKKLIEDLDEEADADEYLFMLAARWADDARGDLEFYPEGGHNEFIHYINKPFKPADQPASVPTNAPAEINIVRAFPDLLAKAKSETVAKERATALCWVFHLVGDAHQPLHTVSLYTETFQLKDHGRLVGDRGGTWFYVRGFGSKSAVSLHHIWDGLITEKDKYRDNRNVVSLLMKNPEHAPEKFADEVKILDVEKWVAESHDLARKNAYFFDGAMLEGSPTKTAAKELPENYTSTVQPIAQRRGALAGYRIAAILKDVVGD